MGKPGLVGKEVNQRKADRLPREAGLKLLSTPRAPRELPATMFIAAMPSATATSKTNGAASHAGISRMKSIAKRPSNTRARWRSLLKTERPGKKQTSSRPSAAVAWWVISTAPAQRRVLPIVTSAADVSNV